MAIMKYTTIIVVFALFAVGQTESGLNFNLQTPDPKCTKLTAILEEFWEALPDGTPDMNVGKYGHFIVTKENIYSHSGLKQIFAYKLGDSEARMELACALTDVKNISGFIPLYRRYSTATLKQVRSHYFAEVERLNNTGLEALKDMGNFAGLLKYAFRMTGFPKFPIDLYDMQMTRDIGDRVLQHLSLWNPDLELTEERKQMFANALRSKTSLEFQHLTGMVPSHLTTLKDYVNTFTDMTKAFSRLVSMLEEMGMFNLE